MPILITSTPRPAATASSRRKGTGRSDGGRFTVEGEVEPPPDAPAATAVLCPLTLLQLQEAHGPEPSTVRAAALRHGADLLDRLEDLRLALLCGTMPQARLAALAEALAARSHRAEDPRLGAVIAEIELRCAVELAKLQLANPKMRPQVAGSGANFLCRSKA